ncbi:MAG: hypothetical protein H7Z39_17455 [Burkholderiaceae bacterium]|nr:hypothetical protein [Burkholderiaceae bacterium]
MLQEVSGYLEKALKTSHTGSALSPLLWLTGIISVPCLLISAVVDSPKSYAFFGLAVVLVIYSMWQYHVLRKINPRLLQSEKLQFEMAKLDLVARKGGAVVFDPVNIEFSAEPAYLGQSIQEDEVEQ